MFINNYALSMVEIVSIELLLNEPKEVTRILSLTHTPLAPQSRVRLLTFLQSLRNDLTVVIEYDYVDATYRDEYYKFYSTKLHHYHRNCTRISFFEPGVLYPGVPVDYSNVDEITSRYLGFLVIRPIKACIGRNIISPQALKPQLSDIAICKVCVNTTVLGLKVSVEGFPHSSQDGEMMACAETSLWSIAEYYGHKYPRYRPVAPTEIMEAMRPSSYQRQLPSQGLTFSQISIGMRTFGFSPEVYQLYKPSTMDPDVQEIDECAKEVFTCYIESGFPLSICLEGKAIGHADVCIGRSHHYTLRPETKNGRTFYYFNQAIDEFVFNDDNYPCYQKAQISAPVSYYTDANWNGVKLTNFMVPLPSKVYMNAFKAIKLSKEFISRCAPDESVIRTYLASCRSLRHHITTSKLLSNENKQLLINIGLPRFVWVTEFGTKDEFENERFSGLILLDATEPNIVNSQALILLISNTRNIAYNPTKVTFENINLTSPFLMERFNNLK